MNDRELLIAAAERAYQQKQAREAKFRAYLCEHLGEDAGLRAADTIARTTDPRVLSEELLVFLIYHGLGLPPGYCLTEEQLEAVLEASAGLKS
jgi:hypothetical protein